MNWVKQQCVFPLRLPLPLATPKLILCKSTKARQRRRNPRTHLWPFGHSLRRSAGPVRALHRAGAGRPEMGCSCPHLCRDADLLHHRRWRSCRHGSSHLQQCRVRAPPIAQTTYKFTITAWPTDTSFCSSAVAYAQPASSIPRSSTQTPPSPRCGAPTSSNTPPSPHPSTPSTPTTATSYLQKTGTPFPLDPPPASATSSTSPFPAWHPASWSETTGPPPSEPTLTTHGVQCVTPFGHAVASRAAS